MLLLAAVANEAETHRPSIASLRGLAVPAGRAPHATYLFKHALVQDAAYGTLLREPRRRFTPASPKPSKLSLLR